VVDEAGNTLGTLHHDGRVLDTDGNVIGGLDEDGNVMLYEQQQPEGGSIICIARTLSTCARDSALVT
jgi:hypothetical protein